jgi:UDP-glucose:(heptosyl)LPS alpha-1,3-glucosyltransferase
LEFQDPSSPFGDPARVVLAGADRFDFVVLSRGIGPEIRELVEWRRVRCPPRPFRLKWLAFYLRAAPVLRGLRADLVHTWGPAPLVPNRVDLATVNYSPANHRAAVRRTQGRVSRQWLASVAVTAIERWHYGSGRTRMLAGVSQSSARELRRLYPSVPTVLIPRSVDAERFRPDGRPRSEERATLGVDPTDPVAVFVGRDWDLKGLAVAIEALAVARRTGAPTARLWVVGDPRWGVSRRRQFDDLARRVGVAGAISYLGFRDDIERLYQAADMFVLPSLTETFSRAAHEAAASGLPVVATPVGGVDELLEDGAAGILVERDPEAVGRAIARLAGDPDLRRRMGEGGRKRCLPLRPERTADAVLDAYERLLRTPR